MILMSIDVLDGNLSSICVVTKSTLGPVLPAMEVCVTVLALTRHIREIESAVAVATCHAGMLTSKWKAGVRMIEADLASDNLPARSGMTYVARDLELSVWAAGGYGGTRNLCGANTH